LIFYIRIGMSEKRSLIKQNPQERLAAKLDKIRKDEHEEQTREVAKKFTKDFRLTCSKVLDIGPEKLSSFDEEEINLLAQLLYNKSKFSIPQDLIPPTAIFGMMGAICAVVIAIAASGPLFLIPAGICGFASFWAFSTDQSFTDKLCSYRRNYKLLLKHGQLPISEIVKSLENSGKDKRIKD